MGASAEEVIADYMVTYSKYYGVENGSEQYEAIAENNIVKMLNNIFFVLLYICKDNVLGKAMIYYNRIVFVLEKRMV